MDVIDKFSGKYEFLSNFSSKSGYLNKPLEYYYQAAKTLNEQEQRDILNAPTPGKAKTLGRKCTLRPDWEHKKIGLMYSLLLWKFGTPAMKILLQRTAPAILVEGNYWGDSFWGVDNKTGKGENWLGRLLMMVRDQQVIDMLPHTDKLSDYVNDYLMEVI